MSGRINIKPPIKDKSTIVKYYQSGEGVFTIEAILGNGQHIKSNEGYVETGYSFNEIISSEGIISHISTISY